MKQTVVNKSVYAPSDQYIPSSLSKFFQKSARSLLGLNYELMLQLRTDTYGMKSIGKKGVCNYILDDKRDKCVENENALITMLEQMCYEFLVQVAGESKGLRLRYQGQKNKESCNEIEIDQS